MRRFILMLVLLVGGVATAVWYLRVAEVKVVGVSSLSTRAIVEASGLEPGDRILWERMSVAERRIERIPAVADAVAERSLPSTVVLRIREREPIALLDGASQLVVDADGVIFPIGEADVPAVLTGWKGRARAGERVDPASRTVLEAMSDFPSVLRDGGRRLVIADGTFTLVISDTTEIRFGVLRDLGAKAEVAMAVLRAEEGNPLAYVDVRSPTVPVSRPRGVPTPQAPSPTPSS